MRSQTPDLLRLTQRTLDSYPHQQRHGTAQPGDPPPHQSSGLLPGWQFCFDADLVVPSVPGSAM